MTSLWNHLVNSWQWEKICSVLWQLSILSVRGRLLTNFELTTAKHNGSFSMHVKRIQLHVSSGNISILSLINLAICRATIDDRELLLFHPEKGTGNLLTLHDEFQPLRYISEFRENAITTYVYQALVVFYQNLVWLGGEFQPDFLNWNFKTGLNLTADWIIIAHVIANFTSRGTQKF